MNSFTKRWGITVIILGIGLLTVTSSHTVSLSLPIRAAADNKPAEGRDTAAKIKVQESYGKLPLSFVQNDGQVDKRVAFYEKGSGHVTYFTRDGIYLNLQKGTPSSPRLEKGLKPLHTGTTSADVRGRNANLQGSHPEIVKLAPLGANKNPKIVAEDLQEGKVNYFIGNDPKKWKTNVPTYQAVAYREIYPGIDMKFYGNNTQLEYDIIVKPGADPSKIKLEYNGIKGLEVTTEGALNIRLSDGSLLQKKPVVYQEINGKRVGVEGKFKLLDSITKKRAWFAYGFELASYDKKYPLMIDPTLVYSTYLGGSNDEVGIRIWVDASGNAYVTGTTASSNFPITSGAYQTSLGAPGTANAFVVKLNASGSGLIYSTYLGGSGSQSGGDDGGGNGGGTWVDASGNAYVTGTTRSPDFPITPAAFQTSYPAACSGAPPILSCNPSAFVLKLNSSGSALLYSTYLGGSSGSFGHGIWVDASGNAYVTGNAINSFFGSPFPVTPGAFQTQTSCNCIVAFVSKLNASGSALIYSTDLGGSSGENGNSGAQSGSSIWVDASGNAYVTGETRSTNFPVTPGAFQTNFGGKENGFVAKLNASGSALIYSTYLGGSGNPATDNGDVGNGIWVDASGNAYVTGYAQSPNFPVTPGSFQASFGGGGFDAFVAKLNASGSALLYSTYLGGSNADSGNGIWVDASGNAYVTGTTASANFPTTPGAFQTNFGGIQNAFVARLNASGSALLYSTYLGGSNADRGNGIWVDASGNAYVTGATQSPNFPVNPGAFQTSLGGGSDAFVAKMSVAATLTSITVTPVNPIINVGQTQQFTATGTFSDGSTRQLGWTTKIPMPTPRSNFGVGVVNGVLYVVGGGGSYNCVGAPLTTVEAYDPTTNTWTTKAPLSTARLCLGVGVVNGILYAVGGLGNPLPLQTNTLSSVEAYDPSTDTWTFKAPMPDPLAFQFGIGVINGILYAVGYNNFGNVKVEAYNPMTDTWISNPSSMTFRDFFGVGIVNSILYAVGGYDSTTGASLNTVEAYDPTTNTWSTRAPMPTPRSAFGAGVVNDILYAVGGWNTENFSTLESYNPTTNTWSTNTPMPTPRHDFSAGVANGTLYAAGGFNGFGTGTTVATLEAYSPPDIVWSSSSTSVATIDSFGLASANNPGITTITATAGNTSGSTTLTVQSAVPQITGISPSSAFPGTSVTISGSNFGAPQGTSTVTFNGVSAGIASSWTNTQIIVAVPAGTTGGPVVVTVSGQSSNGFAFSVPTLQSIAVTPVNPSILVGQTQQFTATGTFSNGSTQVLPVAGVPVSWTSSNSSVATINSSTGLATGVLGGTATITANSGSVNGTTTLTVNNPFPTLTSISPTSAFAGSAAFTLPLTGTNFVTTSSVSLNGQALTTAYVSATQLTAAVPAASVGTAGSFPVTVINPAPGGGTSGSISLAVQDFSFSSISPISVGVGGSGSSSVTVNSLFGFNSPVNLSVSGAPTGITASFSSNPVTPTASLTFTVSLSPLVTPTAFTLTVTGTSAPLTHSTTVSVAVTANCTTINNVMSEMLTAGLINNSGIANALTSKCSAAQTAIGGGQTQTAINILAAFINQVQAQSGQHITSAAAAALITDATALRDTLAMSLVADPIVGYVVNSSGSGLLGATVTLLDSGGSTVATAPTDITGFFYFATTGLLTTGANYTVQVTGFPAGYSTSSPVNQTFTWGGSAIPLANFVLN